MAKSTSSASIYLTDGADWIEHEDCIVGNEPGLKALIKACEAALEEGEYYGSDLGDYVGVKIFQIDFLAIRTIRCRHTLAR